MTSHHPDTSVVPSESELQVLMAEAGGKAGLLAAQRDKVPPRLAHAHDNSKVHSETESDR